MKIINKYIILIIGCILVISASNIQWWKDSKGREDNWVIIETDGKGYYAYLPAIFIYHDLQYSYFETIEEKYYATLRQDFRSSVNGRKVNKYYAGTAVAMAPFFLVAHGLTLATGNVPDGFSKYYNIVINIAGIFYLLAGLYFLRKMLRLYGISETTITIIVVAFTFGTSLYYYAVIEPAMSHIYSFAFVTAFLFYTKDWFLNRKPVNIVYMGILLGMIVLIRPVNGIVIASIPFIAGEYSILKSGILDLFNYFKWLIVSALVCLLICFIQLLLYKLQVGSFIVYSYTNEGFLWTDPQFFNILFSYKKGLFVYTPLLLLSFTGLFFLYKISKFSFYVFLLNFIFVTYILSAWWCWYYGGSFGMRAFIEFYALFAILLALSLKYIQNKVQRSLFIGAIFILTLVCQVQTYQYRYYYIHWSEMTKEHYWEVFMRVDWLIDGSNKPKF
jgi:hypothetical protein